MKTEVGRAAVWQHAEEADLQDVIRKIAAHFDIDDIAIHTPGKLSYVKEPPRKYTRTIQSLVAILLYTRTGIPPTHRQRPLKRDISF